MHGFISRWRFKVKGREENKDYFEMPAVIIALFMVAQSHVGLSIKVSRCSKFHLAIKSLTNVGEISWLPSSQEIGKWVVLSEKE